MHYAKKAARYKSHLIFRKLFWTAVRDNRRKFVTLMITKSHHFENTFMVIYLYCVV